MINTVIGYGNMKDKRLKEIIQNLYKIIKIFCNCNHKNIDDILVEYTNITEEEKEILFNDKKK